MATLFATQVPIRLGAAREGTHVGDSAAVEGAVHALKSSCGQLGASGMQALCEQIEHLAAAGNLVPVSGLLDELQGEFARYTAWLNTQATFPQGEA